MFLGIFNLINNNDLAMIPQEHINRKGRKPGSKNKSTESVRSSFQLLVENNLQQLQSDLNDMTPKERFNSIINLAKFVLPTLNSVDLKNNISDSFKPIEIHFDSDADRKL